MNWLGMMIGAAIDREDGDSGIKGAIIGGITETVVRAAVPLAVTFAIGWGVQYGLRKAVEAAGGQLNRSGTAV
ncbi:MAG TPA: hypothetical protein VF649_02965 [Sphingomonas sp.]|jgi:hypothetical protein|uniref:hypothetical protein n=1 Tax=Sphingomonas sp. TaxID=28214 RepID=UPI002EDB0130